MDARSLLRNIDEYAVVTDYDSSKGVVSVRSGDGEELDITPSQLLQLNGMDETAPFSYNSPDAPTQIGELDIADRFAIKNAGNVKGSIGYLKERYQDAGYHPEAGLVYKENNEWKTVDPDFWGEGDVWDKGREILKDIAVDFLPEAVAKGTVISAGIAKGATSGAIVGSVIPGVGTAAGGIIGGAIGAFGAGMGADLAIKNTFGRIAGTYKATTDEVMRDALWEGVFSLGGYAVPIGVRPAMSKMMGAFQNVAKKGGDVGKQFMRGMMAKTTNIPERSINRLVDNVDEVSKTLRPYTKSTGSTLTIRDRIDDDVIHILRGTREIVDKGRTPKGGLFGGALQQVFKNYDDNAKAVVNAMGKQKFRLDKLNKSIDSYMLGSGLFKRKAKNLAGFKEWSFAPQPKDVVEQKLMAMGHTFSEAQGFWKATQLMAKTMNRVKSNGDTLDADGILKTVRFFNRIEESLSPKARKTFKDIFETGFEQTKAVLTKPLKTHPKAAPLYHKLNLDYTKQKPIAQKAIDMVKEPKQAKNFTRDLVDAENGKLALDFLDDVARIYGNEGMAASNHVMNLAAAKSFTGVVPAMNFLGAVGTGGAIAGATFGGFTPAIAMGVGAAAALGTTPRFVVTKELVKKGIVRGLKGAAGNIARGAGRAERAVNKLIPYVDQQKEWISRLTKTQKEAILNNPALLQSVLHTPFMAAQREEDMARQAREAIQQAAQ